MKIFNKKILSLTLVLVASLGLTSCDTYRKENNAVKKKAIPAAKEYMKNKYNEDVKVKDTYIYATGNGLMFAPPDGDAVVYLKDKDYSVYVDTNTNEVGDNKEVLKLKEAILEETIYKEFNKEQVLNTYSSEPIKTDTIYIPDYRIYSKNKGDVLDFKGKQYFKENLRYENEGAIDFLSKNEMIINIDLEIYLSENTEENIENLKNKFNNIARTFAKMSLSNPSGITLDVWYKDKYLGILAVYNYPEKFDSLDNSEFIDDNWYIGAKWREK